MSTTTTTLLPVRPEAMSPAQLAAVSFLARYSGLLDEFLAGVTGDSSSTVARQLSDRGAVPVIVPADPT